MSLRLGLAYFNKGGDLVEIHCTGLGMRFWYTYLEYVKMANVRRSGFRLWGVYGENSNNEQPFFVNREQSDLEHCAGVSKIQSNLAIFYPNVISFEQLSDYHLVTELHELGENATGDIPDDGRRNNEEKDALEREYVFEHISKNYPHQLVPYFQELFFCFQNRSGVFGRVAYMTDKLDAILQNLVYESEGRGGNANFKRLKNGGSAKDIKNIEITGSDSPADNWLCALLLEDAISYEHIEVIVEIVQSAAFAVRGKEMEWVNEKFSDKFKFSLP